MKILSRSATKSLGRWKPEIRTEVVRWRDQHAPDPELCERIRHDGDAAIIGVGT